MQRLVCARVIERVAPQRLHRLLTVGNHHLEQAERIAEPLVGEAQHDSVPDEQMAQIHGKPAVLVQSLRSRTIGKLGLPVGRHVAVEQIGDRSLVRARVDGVEQLDFIRGFPVQIIGRVEAEVVDDVADGVGVPAPKSRAHTACVYLERAGREAPVVPVGLALDDHGVAAEAVAALGVRVACKRAHAAPGREDKTAHPEVPCPASFPHRRVSSRAQSTSSNE